MGIIKRVSSFFNIRSEDFVPIETMDDKYGPPVILLFGFPEGIDDYEIQDMVSDGAPLACASEYGVKVKRINDYGANSIWLDFSMRDVLQRVMDERSDEKTVFNVDVSTAESIRHSDWQPSCPVVYCSGLSNSEMMATYRIIAREIYEETGGAQAACAKAVLPAMDKSVRQVITEIAGDHIDAMGE